MISRACARCGAGSALYFHTAAELSQHLRVLGTDAALLAQAASGACARARALYSQDVMIERYLELYAALGAPVVAGRVDAGRGA